MRKHLTFAAIRRGWKLYKERILKQEEQERQQKEQQMANLSKTTHTA